MASFDPDDSPRRLSRSGSARLSARPYDPNAPGRSSRAGSRHSAPLGPVARKSAVARQGSAMDVGNDTSSENMDDNDRTKDKAFANSREFMCLFHSHLPFEAKDKLQNQDLNRWSWTGDVDTLTGFALIASAQTCWMWKYSQTKTTMPTCYALPCPESDPPFAPLHAVVPFGSVSGLILMSRTGKTHFWQDASSGLAGGKSFQLHAIALYKNETVTTLSRADNVTYVASTSTGRLFRLMLRSSGQEYHLVSHVFTQAQPAPPPPPTSAFSRFLPSSWSTPAVDPIPQDNISAVTIGKNTEEGQELWTILGSRVQKWLLSPEEWEEMQYDEDVSEVVTGTIREAFPTLASILDENLDLTLDDVLLEPSGKLLVLVSYLAAQDPTATDQTMPLRRQYAIVYLSRPCDNFEVEKLISVPYQTHPDARMPMHNRVKLMHSGSLIVIQFDDVVAICARDNMYRDHLVLKSSADRVFGVGISPSASQFLVMTASLVVAVNMYMEAVAEFDPLKGRGDIIRSIMMQAIVFGEILQNPLHFSFPPDVDENSLMSGALALSQAVLESDSEVVRGNIDQNAQMISRKQRLGFLIKFINDNHVLPKMSQKSRQRLAADAELMYSSHQLWVMYNEDFQPRGVLARAVHEYMDQIREMGHHDRLRAFFRLHVADLESLLVQVIDVVREAPFEVRANYEDTLHEAASIIVTVIRAGLEYRSTNFYVYGIEPPLYNPWTSRPVVINIICELFEKTVRLLEAPAVGFVGSKAGLPGLKANLVKLASLMFACFCERLNYLQSPAADDDMTADTELSELDEQYEQLRPDVLDTLRRNGLAEQAFQLAEEYRDFRSLAALCHKDTVYPPHENPNAPRIQSYIERFRDEFTTELFNWYIEHGELRTLFALSGQYAAYVDEYFEKYPRPTISWLHDIDRSRYLQASESLLETSQSANSLAGKHFMLSVGILSYIAHPGPVPGSTVTAFSNALDFISVQETVLHKFKTVDNWRSDLPLDTQAEIVANAVAQPLQTERTGVLFKLYKVLLRRMLEGDALSTEDLVDVLSMKNNVGSLGDFTTALQLLARAREAKEIPEDRVQNAFRAVWRRIYLHDNWGIIRETAGVSDERIRQRLRSTALYHVLQDLKPARTRPPGYIQLPSDAVIIPTTEEIEARWPAIGPDQAYEIEESMAADADMLADLTLEDEYERVKELAYQEAPSS